MNLLFTMKYRPAQVILLFGMLRSHFADLDLILNVDVIIDSKPDTN